ncbi:MAG: CopG family antitoxin [Nitrospinota bacterium]
MKENKCSIKRLRATSLSQSRSIMELSNFWDEHDITDYSDKIKDVKIEVDVESRHHYVSILPELMQPLMKEAYSKGVTAQSLINALLQEHILKNKLSTINQDVNK